MDFDEDYLDDGGLDTTDQGSDLGSRLAVLRAKRKKKPPIGALTPVTADNFKPRPAFPTTSPLDDEEPLWRGTIAKMGQQAGSALKTAGNVARGVYDWAVKSPFEEGKAAGEEMRAGHPGRAAGDVGGFVGGMARDVAEDVMKPAMYAAGKFPIFGHHDPNLSTEFLGDTIEPVSGLEAAGSVAKLAAFDVPLLKDAMRAPAMIETAARRSIAGNATFKSALERAKAQAMEARTTKARTGGRLLGPGQYEMGPATTRLDPETDPSRLLPASVGPFATEGERPGPGIPQPAATEQITDPARLLRAKTGPMPRVGSSPLGPAIPQPAVGARELAARTAEIEGERATTTLATPDDVETYRLNRDRNAGVREQFIERLGIQADRPVGERPRSESTGAMLSLGKSSDQQLFNEYRALHDANAVENPFPSAGRNAFGEEGTGFVRSVTGEGAMRSAGRIAQRGKSIAKVEEELTRRGIDHADAYFMGEEAAPIPEGGETPDFSEPPKGKGRKGATSLEMLSHLSAPVAGAAGGAAAAPEGRKREGAVAGAVAGLGLSLGAARLLKGGLKAGAKVAREAEETGAKLLGSEKEWRAHSGIAEHEQPVHIDVGATAADRMKAVEDLPANHPYLIVSGDQVVGSGRGPQDLWTEWDDLGLPKRFHAGGGAPPVRASAERVVAPAVKYGGGEVFTGKTHLEAAGEGEKAGVRGEPVHEGFVTDKGRYVDRDEANEIAFPDGEDADLTHRDLPFDKAPVGRFSLRTGSATADVVKAVAGAGAGGAVAASKAPEGEKGAYFLAGAGLGAVAPTLMKKAAPFVKQALTDAYAPIRAEAPELHAALHSAGAMTPAKAGAFTAGMVRNALRDLTTPQKEIMGRWVAANNLEAVALARATAPEGELALKNESADAAAKHVAALRASIPKGVENQDWFKTALDRYKTAVEPFTAQNAEGAGVKTMREPSNGAPYMRLISQDRLNERMIGETQEAAARTPGSTTPRTGFAKKFLGQPEPVARLTPKGAEGPIQGPANRAREEPAMKNLPPGTAKSASSKMATGKARRYVTDLETSARMDAEDKVAKAQRNAVYEGITKAPESVARELPPTENPRTGWRTVVFNDMNQLVPAPPAGKNIPVGYRRFEVSPDVAEAVDRFHHQILRGKTGQAVRKGMGAVTRSVLIDPAVGGGHALTLASTVGTAMPADAGVGKALATGLPLVKVATTLRRFAKVDFDAPATAERVHRLALSGALRVSTDEGGGAINWAHHKLFGPTGIDPRARVVASEDFEASWKKAGLSMKDPAYAAAERDYVTSHAGNYSAKNPGTAAQWLQDTGIAPFIAVNRAKYGTAAKALAGKSGQVGLSLPERAVVAARGPLGAAGIAAGAGYLLSGHAPNENAPGHESDIATGVYQLPQEDGSYSNTDLSSYRHFRGSVEDAKKTLGPRAREIYLRKGSLDPSAAAAIRILEPIAYAKKGDMVSDLMRTAANTVMSLVGPAPQVAFTGATGHELYLDPQGELGSVQGIHLHKDAGLVERLEAMASKANAGAAAALPAEASHGRGPLTAIAGNLQPFAAARPQSSNAADELMGVFLQHRMPGTQPAEQVAQEHERRVLRQRAAEEGWAAVREEVVAKAKRGEITKSQEKQIERAAKTHPSVLRFEDLTLDQAEQVFKRGTDEQKKLWRAAMVRKRINAQANSFVPR